MTEMFSKEKGQAYLELLVIVPFMLMLVLLVVEISFLTHDWLVLEQALRYGLRQAEIDGGVTPKVIAGIRDQLTMGYLVVDRVEIDGTPPEVPWGEDIILTISYDYELKVLLVKDALQVVDTNYHVPLLVRGITTSERASP